MGEVVRFPVERVRDRAVASELAEWLDAQISEHFADDVVAEPGSLFAALEASIGSASPRDLEASVLEAIAVLRDDPRQKVFDYVPDPGPAFVRVFPT